MKDTTIENSRLRPFTSPLAAGIVLVIFYTAMLASLRHKSATFDEPGHAIAGIAYWKFGDFRLDPENGNLTQRWIALPLLRNDFVFPATDSDAWQHADIFKLSDEWLNRVGNDAETMLARGRAGSGILAVALGALVWWWSRRLFGPPGGMLSLLLYVLTPAILANGALMTSDTAGALFLLLSLGCVWRMLQQPSLFRVIGSAAVMGALFVVKMSAVLIVPVALLLVVARVFDHRPWALGPTRPLASRPAKALALTAVTLLHVGAIFLVVWAAYGFRYEAFSAGESKTGHFDYPWEWALDQPDHGAVLNALPLDAAQQPAAMAIFRAHGVTTNGWSHASLTALREVQRVVLTPEQARRLDAMLANPPLVPAARLVRFARQHRLLPEAYLFGWAHVWRLSRVRSAFFNGEVRDSGWPSFFPYTFAVKTPLALLVLVALALVALATRTGVARRGFAAIRAGFRLDAPTLPLWLFLGTYWLAAITSRINIGHRHILPVYPPLFVLGGAAVLGSPWWSPRLHTRLVGVLLAVLALDVGFRFPNYLAYFNGLVRPATAYRHLVDSSLEWGQELPALQNYLATHSTGGPTYLAYFGVGSPARHGIAARQIYGFFGYEKAARPVLRLEPVADTANFRAAADDFLRREPDYDPNIVSTVDFGGKKAALFLKRAPALRLTGGTYCISASLIQPVVYTKAWGPWTPAHESVYQRLRVAAQPLLSDDPAARAAALERRSFREWLEIFDDYDEYRFARLTAFLRLREPDETINYSILVYHLTEADLVRALDGPPP